MEQQPNPHSGFKANSAAQADDLFRAAHAHHLAGRAQDAEKNYRAALAVNPHHAESLHFLGVLALQFGHPQIAVQFISQSVAIAPAFASTSNLGEALRQAGQLKEALHAFHRSLEIKPDHVDAIANLGVTLTQLQRLDDAEIQLRRALTLNPSHVGAVVGLAMLLDQRIQSAAAATSESLLKESFATWERVVRVAPNHAKFQTLFGDACVRVEDLYRAASAFRRAIELQPSDAETYAKLGYALTSTGKVDEGLAAVDRAIELSPEKWEAHRERARMLEKLDRQREALESYKRALALQPASGLLHGDVGRLLSALRESDAALEYFQIGQSLEPGDFRFPLSQSRLLYEMERYPEATAAARQAIKLAPHDADAHAGLAFALLMDGEFEEGFREYEWRWRAPNFTTKPRQFDQPLWDGSEIANRSLLLHSEQGFGDTIQFLRYVPLLLRRGIRVIVEVPYKLAGLVARMSPALHVVIQGTILPRFDLHVPMLSLPAIFRTTAARLPSAVPYLRADANLSKRWRERLDRELGELQSTRVGLVWGGNTKPDPHRSARLADFAPLASSAQISLISLQADESAKQADDPPAGMKVLNVGPELRDFSDTTASVLDNLDLLITIDTSTAHLAGAMGVRTWLLLRRPPDWRWRNQTRESPWYPTMRLFRQSKLDDWASVMIEVAEELKQLSERQGNRLQSL